MILTPSKVITYQKLSINKMETALDKEKSNAVLPLKIYLFEDLLVDKNCTPANFMTKRAFLQNNGSFNFFVDEKDCWELLPPADKIVIGVIEISSFKNLLILLKYLQDELDITFQPVSLNFYDKDFLSSLIQLKIQPPAQQKKEKIDYSKTSFSDLMGESAIEPPVLKCEVFCRGKWQPPNFKDPIMAIRLITSEGDLCYKVFTKNTWYNWVQAGEVSGEELYLIKGLQIEFTHKYYDLYYRCTLINGEKTLWRSNPLTIPYKKAINGIEFKLIEK